MAGDNKVTGPDLTTEGLPLEALSSDLPAVGHVDGKPVVIVQTPGGPRAVSGRCTHYGGPLGKGLCVSGEIRCPWHHASFDLETGAAVGAPALNPLPLYDTVVRDGRIFVTGAKQPAPTLPTPPAAPDSVVIVGAGAAGAAAAETLRNYGFREAITLIGDEAPVDRPNVSKDYLAGTAPEDWMPLRPLEYYSDHGIDLILGNRVVSLDAAARTVQLDDGRSLTYGALLLAPGAEPRRLKLPGADLPHVHYLRTLEDGKAVIAALEGVTRVVVIGAGFIGLEVAASLRQRDINVTVVAPEEIPLARIIGETLGEFVAGLHREHGVEFRLGTGVTAITEHTVELEDGSSVDADLVIVGVGVSPRTELAQAAGLTIDNGIVVNAQLRTSDPHIWAAGDAARFPGPGGEPVRVEHWVLAERHGQTAARNMLGHDITFTESPFFWSQHYDVPINVTGHLNGWDEDVVVGDVTAGEVLVAYRRAGVIRAVATVHRDRDNLRAEHALGTNDQHALEALLAE